MGDRRRLNTGAKSQFDVDEDCSIGKNHKCVAKLIISDFCVCVSQMVPGALMAAVADNKQGSSRKARKLDPENDA